MMHPPELPVKYTLLKAISLCALVLLPHAWAQSTLPQESDPFPPDTIQAGVRWDAGKAKALAFRHLERQIQPHFFETQKKEYFENVKGCEDNPDLKFSKCQATEFPDGAYSQAFEGEKNGLLLQPYWGTI